MRMKMRDSKFGAPAGVYQGEFLGCSEFKGDGKPRFGRDGKPMPPAMEWQFRITGGDHDGQIVGRLTAQEPTTRNSCGVLLAGLVGRVVAPDEEVEVDLYRGQTYQIVISPSKEDPERTYVTQIIRTKPANGPAPPAAAPPPPPPAAAPAAPPAPAKQTAPDAEPEYWLSDGSGEVKRATGTFIRSLIRDQGVDAGSLQVCRLDNKSDWQHPSHWGLDEAF
jgi:hypothetical protein